MLVYAAITEEGGEKFWFHGLRNSFISVAESTGRAIPEPKNVDLERFGIVIAPIESKLDAR